MKKIHTKIIRETVNRWKGQFNWYVEDIFTHHIYLKAFSYNVTTHGRRYVFLAYVESENEKYVFQLLLEMIETFRQKHHILEVPADLLRNYPQLYECDFFPAADLEETYDACMTLRLKNQLKEILRKI